MTKSNVAVLAPAMALEFDKEGYIVFAVDRLEKEELIEYLFQQVFTWVEELLKRPLPEDSKEFIRTHYSPTTAKRFIMRDAERFLDGPIAA